MSIDFYFKNIKKYKPLTWEEEITLFKKAKNGDKNSYDKIILSNVKFVISVAREYISFGIPLEDLVSEGVIGLIKAYEKFDITKGFKFISYAVWWIRQSILRFIANESKIIRLPQNKLNSINKISKIKEYLEKIKGREININELEELLNDPTLLEDCKYDNQILNLDQPLTDDEENLHNLISDEDALIKIEKKFISEELDEILKIFNDREKEIICLYFGIKQPRSYTLTEISHGIGLTKERIRQIKENALSKIKNNNKLINKLKELDQQ